MITFILSTFALAADPAPPAAPPTTTPSTTAPSKTTPATPSKTAPAATPTAPAGAVALPVFADLDLNKDLSLDKTELAKIENLTRDFATIDTDKNSKLSQDEFKAWSDKQAKPATTPPTKG